MRILVILFFIALAGCGNTDTGDIHTSLAGTIQKGADHMGELPPVPENSDAFGWLAMAGAGMAAVGGIAIIVSAFIGSTLVRRTAFTAVATGISLAVIAYAIPRWSYIFETYIAKNLHFYVTGGCLLAIWAASIYLTRLWTYPSAYTIGYKDGEDGSPPRINPLQYLKIRYKRGDPPPVPNSRKAAGGGVPPEREHQR